MWNVWLQDSMGDCLQHNLHPLVHGLDGVVPAGLPGQPQDLLDDGGGHVQLDAVHGRLLELVRGIQHHRVRGESRQSETSQTFDSSKPSKYSRCSVVDDNIHSENRSGQQSDVDHGPSVQVYSIWCHIMGSWWLLYQIRKSRKRTYSSRIKRSSKECISCQTEKISCPFSGRRILKVVIILFMQRITVFLQETESHQSWVC